MPSVDLLRTPDRALVRPVPARPTDGGPAAARGRQNPPPRRPTLASTSGPDLTRAPREPRKGGAFATGPPRPSPPVRRPRNSGPLRPSPPSPPDPPVPCGTVRTPTVGPDPRTRADPSTPSLRADVAADPRGRRRPSRRAWSCHRPSGSHRPSDDRSGETPPPRQSPAGALSGPAPASGSRFSSWLATKRVGDDRCGLVVSSLSLTGPKGLKPAADGQPESPRGVQIPVDGNPG